MSYRFVQGIDYGPAKGRLGWNVHMSEGGDGLVTYLARQSGETLAQWKTRVRGASCNFAILSTGEVIQMVAWDRSAGNLNPFDRSTDKDFYGRRFLLEVLGDKWTDPNAYTLSCEMAGFRSKGPTRPQVEALVKLVAESRERYPQMVGAFGHADQTDTKGCPGTAPTMLETWTRIGHGKFTETEMVYSTPGRTSASVEPGTTHHETPNGRKTGTITNGAARYDVIGQDKAEGREWVLLDGASQDPVKYAKGYLCRWVRASALRDEKAIPDAGLAVESFRERARTAAVKSVGDTIDAVPGGTA